MKHSPIVPADVDFSDPGVPRAPAFGDVYHAAAGAFEQAGHVFLAGNGLPERWRGREAFVVLETGFGLGNNFLATWAAWRADPQRSRVLRFVSIEKHPPRVDDLRRALAGSVVPELAVALCDAWPPLTPDLHSLSFDDGRVELLLAFGDVQDRLRDLVASVDAFFLDGFAPRVNPRMWDAHVFKSLSRLAAPGATAATWSAARVVREGLQQAGFEWREAPGRGGKRDITLATFAPRAPQRRPAARVGDARVRHVAIIGAGLAGAACARALARAGLRCTVLDTHAEPAREASGNIAGLFHGVFHPDDGAHARAHRAAALMAQRAHADAIARGVPGRVDGLVRLVPDEADATPLAAALAGSGLPPEFVQAWTPAQVAAVGGPASPAWFYPGGGWIAPAALVREWLRDGAIAFRGSAEVARIDTAPQDDTDTDDTTMPRWRLLDAHGALLAEVDAVVIANAHDALALISRIDTAPGMPEIARDALPPLQSTRGQVSVIAPGTPGPHAPVLPIAGAGYALALPDGATMCGATTAVDDADPAVRPRDHSHNLRQLAAVTGAEPLSDADLDPLVDRLVADGRLSGRVGWRASMPDRLPLVGALPARVSDKAPDQPRHWPRVPGLFIATALGSRGLTWAPLVGRLIVSWIADAPFPLPADLVDALDPARFATRAVRASRRPLAPDHRLPPR